MYDKIFSSSDIYLQFYIFQNYFKVYLYPYKYLPKKSYIYNKHHSSIFILNYN